MTATSVTFTCSGRGMTDDALTKFRRGLQLKEDALPYEEVDFSKNAISARGIREVLEVCRRCPRLKVLKIYQNLIDDDGARELAKLFSACPTIEEVHLSHNRLTAVGVKCLISAAAAQKRPFSKCPIWMRLEHNRVAGADAVLKELSFTCSICLREDERQCTTRTCCKKMQVHLPFFNMQRVPAVGYAGKSGRKGAPPVAGPSGPPAAGRWAPATAAARPPGPTAAGRGAPAGPTGPAHRVPRPAPDAALIASLRLPPPGSRPGDTGVPLAPMGHPAAAPNTPQRGLPARDPLGIDRHRQVVEALLPQKPRERTELPQDKSAKRRSPSPDDAEKKVAKSNGSSSPNDAEKKTNNNRSSSPKDEDERSPSPNVVEETVAKSNRSPSPTDAAKKTKNDRSSSPKDEDERSPSPNDAEKKVANTVHNGAADEKDWHIHRQRADKAAKDILEAAQKEGVRISDENVYFVLQLWGFKPNTSRHHVLPVGATHVLSDTIGYVPGKGSEEPFVSYTTKQFPNFTRLLTQWLEENMNDELKSTFNFTSMSVNKNLPARRHRDTNNDGPSLVKAFGEFTGGELRYFPRDSLKTHVDVLNAKDSVCLAVDRDMLLFNGSHAHSVNAFEGNRYSVVFFSISTWEKVPKATAALERINWGIRFPTDATMTKCKALLAKSKTYRSWPRKVQPSPCAGGASSGGAAAQASSPRLRWSPSLPCPSSIPWCQACSGGSRDDHADMDWPEWAKTEKLEQQDSWTEEEWAIWLEPEHEAKPAEAKDKQKAKGKCAMFGEAKPAKGQAKQEAKGKAKEWASEERHDNLDHDFPEIGRLHFLLRLEHDQRRSRRPVIVKMVRAQKAKKASAKGSMLDQIEKLEARSKNQHKEASERCTSDMMLTEAKEKLKAVVECVQKAADAERPFIMGMEGLPLEQTLDAVKACDNAATLANKACSEARMFLATKIVEARRMVSFVGSKTLANLKDFQSELEHQMKNLGDISKKSTATQKRDATMREAQSEVAKAEGLAAAVGEAARFLTDGSKFLELPAQEIRVAADQTAKAEQAVLAAKSAAQIESKGKDVSAEVNTELIKLRTRLLEAQSNITKHQRLCGNFEAQLASKKVIEEANAKVQDCEEKIQKLCEAVEQFSTKQDAEDSEAAKRIKKVTDKFSVEAQVAMRSTHRWFESVKGIVEDEIHRLKPRIKDAQDKLDATIKACKEVSEKISIEQIVKDFEEQIKEAEASFEKVTAAEMPFLKGMEDLPAAAKLLENLEVAVTESQTAVNAANRTLAVKSFAAKRLSEGSAASTLQALESLQQRLDAVMKNVMAAKHRITERKVATVLRHGEDKAITAEQKVAEASEATKALADVIDFASADIKSLCEKAGIVQTAASAVVSETKIFLQQQLRDTKLITGDTAMHRDLAKLLDKLVIVQASLDKQKAILRDQEHKIVAQRVHKDAEELVCNLDAKLKSTVELAAPLTDEAGDLASLSLSHITTAMKQHKQAHTKTVAALFEEIGEQAPRAEAKFVDFCLSKLPELQENNDETLAKDQVKLAFKRIDTKSSGEVVEADFNEHFRERWVVAKTVAMTDVMEVKGSAGGKTVRKLVHNEILEQLEEPVKQYSVGLLRVKVKAVQDEKEGYVTVESNAGKTYLNRYDPIMTVEAEVQQALQELLEMCAKASKYIEAKRKELKSVREGPLAETRTALQAMETLVRNVQQERKKLKKCIAETKEKKMLAIKNEKRKKQEAIEQEEADRVLTEAMKPATEAAEQLETAVAAAQVLVASRGKTTENPLQAMDEAEKALNSSLKQVEAALTVIKQFMYDMKNVGKGPLAETRSAIAKLNIKAGAFETKGKKQLAALAGARKQVTQDAEEVLQGALRHHAISQAWQPCELFKRLCGDAEAVSPAALRSFLEGIANSTLKLWQLDLGVQGLAASISQLPFWDVLQEYRRCVKKIAITTVCEASLYQQRAASGDLTVEKLVGAPEVVQTAKIDVCLIDALRAHGFAIPYDRDGPLWAQTDGNCLLSTFHACLIRIRRPRRPGSYVCWANHHFFAMEISKDLSVRLHGTDGKWATVSRVFPKVAAFFAEFFQVATNCPFASGTVQGLGTDLQGGMLGGQDQHAQPLDLNSPEC